MKKPPVLRNEGRITAVLPEKKPETSLQINYIIYYVFLFHKQNHKTGDGIVISEY